MSTIQVELRDGGGKLVLRIVLLDLRLHLVHAHRFLRRLNFLVEEELGLRDVSRKESVCINYCCKINMQIHGF